MGKWTPKSRASELHSHARPLGSSRARTGNPDGFGKTRTGWGEGFGKLGFRHY
jgi:hypothetical protein